MYLGPLKKLSSEELRRLAELPPPKRAEQKPFYTQKERLALIVLTALAVLGELIALIYGFFSA